MQPFLIALILAVTGYTIGSIKVINQGNEALVERLGRYHRKLNPGINFVLPFLDNVVLEDTIREQVLDIDPQEAITKDNVPLEADAVIYWKVMDLEKAYYTVENVEEAIQNLVSTTLRSAIGGMLLTETSSSRGEINQALIRQLDEAAATWGVKVTRVEVQKITPSPKVLQALESERAAESRKRADILEAEGTVQSIRLISQALQSQPNTREVLKFILAEKFVEANQKLGESPNAKVIFMDPKAVTEAVEKLIEHEIADFHPGQDDSHTSSGNGSSHS